MSMRDMRAILSASASTGVTLIGWKSTVAPNTAMEREPLPWADIH